MSAASQVPITRIPRASSNVTKVLMLTAGASETDAIVVY